MRTLRFLAAGVALTMAGLFYAYANWSVAVLMTPTCSGHWDDLDHCRSLAWRCYAAFAAPLPGLLLILIAFVRFIVWWRTPIVHYRPVADDPPVVDGRLR